MMSDGVSRRGFLSGAAAFGGVLAAAPSSFAQDTRPGRRAGVPPDEDGYDLWLRYRPIEPSGLLESYRRALSHVVAADPQAVIASAVTELGSGLTGLLDRDVPVVDAPEGDGAVIVGTRSSSPLIAAAVPQADLDSLGDEGYLIRHVRVNGFRTIVVASAGEAGVLYGCFHLLRLVQTHRPLGKRDLAERPASPLRLANHWDAHTRVVTWGYVGLSIFRWDDLPELDPRYADYARALASIGMNGSVVNLVNADHEFLTSEMIEKLVPLAEVFRAWGISLYLSANFFAPRILGGLATADPLDEGVRAWWRAKADEIYAAIPDFGGFLVKADSEGQPGPLTYGRTHAEGANALADALRPHGGVVIWRAFVGHEGGGDFLKAAYDVFQPLDGDFADNAIVQVKHGPLDFQTREPVHPLFGAMPNTNLMLEVQVTKEYTGSVRHLFYMPSQWAEVLDFDTHAAGTGTTVADVISGQVSGSTACGMAGVMNIGSETNWTRHHLSAANTHGFGRLAWNSTLDPAELAEEWVRMTYGNDDETVAVLTGMLLASREIYESYTSPGMCGMTGRNDPSPGWGIGVQPTATHIGNDRTVETGTGSIAVYPPPVAEQFGSLDTCPPELLLFFHQVPYEHLRPSGENVLQTIYDSYFDGVEDAVGLREDWLSLEDRIDPRRFAEVLERFDDQLGHATDWRDRMAGHIFAVTERLDTKREWLQLDLPLGTVLTQPPELSMVSGWPNDLTVRVGNASAAARTVEVGVGAPAGWGAEAVTVDLAAAALESTTIAVTPPLDPVPARIAATTDADGLVLGTTSMPVFLAPAGQRAAVAIDAGPNTATVPVQDGYRRLGPADTWDPARGFGWVPDAGTTPTALDRGSAFDALRRDLIYGFEPATLRVAVPPGRYTALLLVGDREWAPIYPTYVRLDGELVAEGEQHLAGAHFEWLRFAVDGGASGREIDLELSTVERRWELPQQEETTGAWHLNALVLIDLDAPMPEIAAIGFDVPQPMTCGVPNSVAVTLANTTDDLAAEVSIEVTVPDGWAAEAVSATVAAGQTAVVEVPVTPPAEPTLGVPVTVSVTSAGHSVGGGRYDTECIAVPDGAQAALALDAGPAASPLVGGYQRLAPETAWDAARGYGWVGDPPQSRDRGSLDGLRRDFVNDVEARTLRIAVPAGTHHVDLLIGDGVAPCAPTYVHAGSTLLAESPPLGAVQFVWLGAKLDGGATGTTIDLTFSGDSGQHWHLNSFVLIAG